MFYGSTGVFIVIVDYSNDCKATMMQTEQESCQIVTGLFKVLNNNFRLPFFQAEQEYLLKVKY